MNNNFHNQILNFHFITSLNHHQSKAGVPYLAVLNIFNRGMQALQCFTLFPLEDKEASVTTFANTPPYMQTMTKIVIIII